MENEIKESLIALLGGIKAADGKTIASEMKRLDELAHQHAREIHPQLLHFLHNRSYAKAALWLDGDANVPAGVCGKVAKRSTAS